MHSFCIILQQSEYTLLRSIFSLQMLSLLFELEIYTMPIKPEPLLNQVLKQKIIQICNDKIRQKGDNVGLSFYAFFANKNDDPETLMQVATWWIQTHKLDHFEKAAKIKKLISQDEIK